MTRCCDVRRSLLLFSAVILLHLRHAFSLPPVQQMSSADVHSWLQSLSLPQYAPAFSSHHIDGASLTALSASDLQTIGVEALGHRKKILKAIEQLKHTPSSPSSSSSSPSSSQPTFCEVGASGEASCADRVYVGVRSADEDTSSENWFEEPFPHPYDTERCTIDRIPYDRMTPALFMREYYVQKPFILVPTPQSAKATLAVRRAWARSTILSTLGHIPVNLGTPHSLTAFGDGVISSTLGAYIRDLRNASIERISGDHYLFDRKGFFKQADVLLDSYQPHRLFHWDTNHAQYGHSDSMTFALGPTGSGINFHYHKVTRNRALSALRRSVPPASVGRSSPAAPSPLSL